MVDDGYISVQSHPDDPDLKVMNYSRAAQYEGKWNDATKNARGLMIRSARDDFGDAVVVERPWKKFFTLSQIRNDDGTPGWALGDEEENSSSVPTELDRLDFSAPANVTDKMDGSMGILYEAPDGKLAIATKGSFRSDQAVMYTKMLRENTKYYDAAKQLRDKNTNTTFVFELIGKDNQIVVPYDENDITFIGAVDRNDGKYHTVTEYSEIWSKNKGLTTTEVMPANNLQEALSLPDREGREGVVVMIQSDDLDKQMQIKIKQEDYLKLHRVLYSTSVKNIVELAQTGTYEEKMGVVPKKMRRNHDEIFHKVMNIFEQNKKTVEEKYDRVKHIEDQKEFALAVKDDPDAPMLFARRKNPNWESTIWRKMLKNDVKNLGTIPQDE